MKRVPLGLGVMMWAAAAAAQSPAAAVDQRQPSQMVVSAKAVMFDSGETAAPAFFRSATAASASQPRPSAPSYRRRPSFVGYIDDSSISSKVRVRYDLAYGNTAPDRAEFFYAKCGCYRDLENAAPDLFDPDSPGPGPGATNNLDFRQFLVLGEYATSDRVSVFVELPIRTVLPDGVIDGTVPPGQTAFGDHTGIGDISAGAKFGVTGNDMYDLVGQVKAFLPTGDSEDGLGTDHFSLEPSLLYNRQLAARASIETQVGFWIPFGGAVSQIVAEDGKFSGTVFFYGFGPSFDAIRTDKIRVAPVVELVGWAVLDGNETILNDAGTGLDLEASGANIINLKFGARIAWNDRGSFYIGYGKALTDAKWYDDILRFEYRHGF